MVKGLGYALEAMMASAIVFMFIFGAVEVSNPDQDWDDFQREVASQDLTRSMKASGHLTSFLSRGELGSLQTSITEISDRDMEVSGAVSNLPISQIDIGYFAVQDKRENQDIVKVDSGDRCHGELQELKRFAETSEIYRTSGGLEEDYGVRLYFANTNPKGVEVDTSGFDTLWVDNGTQQCQFSSSDGPFYLDQIFYWGDSENSDPSDFFEFHSIDTGAGESTFYKASQPRRIQNILNQEVNGIETSTHVDMVDFNEIENSDYSILIFPERDSLPDINSNMDTVISHLVSKPVLLLMNPEEDDLDSGLLEETGFEWIDTDRSGYGSGAVDAAFSSERPSLDIKTLYLGLDGDPNFQLYPPGKVVSNTSSRLEASQTIYSSSTKYDFSEWDRSVTGMSPGGTNPTDCSDSYEGTVDFEDSSPIDFLNIAVGDSCNSRALIFDFNGSGYDSDFYLNGESVKVANREYSIDLVGCGTEGECADFKAQGQQNIELMPNTASFKTFNGDQLALLGHNHTYNEDQRKTVASSIYYLLNNEVRFEGRVQPEEVSTSAIGGIKEDVYMPYKINLRWSE